MGRHVLVTGGEHIDRAAGQVYNIGGAPANTISVWGEFEPLLRDLLGRPIDVRWAPSRPGDQRVFYADTRKAARELEWQPTIPAREGIASLFAWIARERDLLARSVAP